MPTPPAPWRLALAGLVVAAAAAPAAAPRNEPKKGPTAAEQVRKELDQPVTIDILDQPLALAVNQLREQTKINFVLDTVAVAQLGVDANQAPANNARLKGVKVRDALRGLLMPFNLTYVVLGDTVLITTEEVAVYRQMRQRVNVDLDRVELAAALKGLARETATNLIVDARVAKEAQAPVTLQAEDVPLETAVRLLAEMAGLKPVRVGNVLFVTAKANAVSLRADPDLAPAPTPRGVNALEGVMVAPGGGAIALPAVPAPAVVPATPPPAAPAPAPEKPTKPADGGDAPKPDREKPDPP
jgi:hypothetical protein